MPTCPIPAPPLDAVDETVSPLSSLTRGANYLDLPAASVPCGLTDAGLPVGLQIIGRRGDEAGVVAVATRRMSGFRVGEAPTGDLTLSSRPERSGEPGPPGTESPMAREVPDQR
jgi:aspartyl-tRNA(Asn)/glutamyl-tRNA(Gln) amidotransferase subunit A